MSENEDRETKPLPRFTYRLKPGFTHYRDGSIERMEAGELIDMTEVRFDGANLGDRFELFGTASPVEIRTSTSAPTPTPVPAVPVVPAVPEGSPPVVPVGEFEFGDDEPGVDWSSTLDASWSSVVKTIKSLDDVDYIRSLLEAERGGRRRGSILRAASARIRQLSK